MKSKKETPKINKSLTKSSNNFPVVGIGASAGGLNAFKKLLKAIPENSGLAYVLVQHLSPSQESLLPDLLQKVTNIPVLEIADDIKVEPDHIYIIPANKMLIANDGVLQLSPRPALGKDQRNLPIDLFFASLAEVHQSHSIGVVLSGTASDGTLGLKAIKNEGGTTFAQDEESAEYKEMPRNAVQAGVVDFILSPEKIPEKLLEITKIFKHNDVDGQNEPDAFKQILSLLRIRKTTDFTYYKQTTIRRRILRRMALNNKEELSDYLKYLRENKSEQDALYQDLLIPVTSFFRDTQSFEQLCGTVLKKIIDNKTSDDFTRIWVAGCSTGEEAYSIAICLKELSGDKQLRVQIFATDISEPAIAKARTGIYTKSEMESMTPQRLRDFFTKTNGSYQVNKELRDTCVFAVHNFLKDPPFGNMDLISCRNVLIYMEPYLQKKALTTFHYALNSKGFLFLGKSETISTVPDFFAALNKSDKLFSRKDAPGRTVIPVISQSREQNFREQGVSAKRENLRTDFQKTADDIILSRYTPAGVVVNEMMDIVHYRGNTSDYLQQPAGKPSHNLLKLAKAGLAFELHNILHKVKKGELATRKESQPIIKEDVPLKINGSQHTIAIEALSLPNVAEPHYLILFHRAPSIEIKPSSKDNKKTARGKEKSSDSLRIQQLERNLELTHEDMRGIADDQEAAYEELQSANEELQSGSEELRSLNEELETSKEELQSTNEELTVVNQQLVGLNHQITEERNFADAIVTTIREPLLVLNRNLRVKAANKSFFKTFLVNEHETEGKLIYDLGDHQWDIPELRTLLERVLPEKEAFSDFEVAHNFQSIGQRTMLINGREIAREQSAEKLILLAIEDITERKESERLSSIHSALVNSSGDAIISKTLDGIITTWNKGAEQIFGYTAAEAVGKPIKFIIPPDLQQEGKIIIDKIKRGEEVLHFDTIRLARDGRRVNMSLTISPVKDDAGKITAASIIAQDITERIQAEKILKNNEAHFRHLVKNLPAGVYSCDAQGYITFYNNAAVKIWGREPEAGKDQWCGSWKMIGPDGSPFPAEVCPMAIAFKEGRAIMGEEITVERPDGTRSIVQVYPQPLFGLSGKITGAINMVIDITEQNEAARKIEESEKRFNNLLMQSPFAFSILKGEDLVVHLANNAIKETWGKGSDLEGKKLLDILPEIGDQVFPGLLQEVYKTGTPHYAHEILAKLVRKGILEDVYFNFVYQPYREVDGTISGVVIIAHEVTPQALFNKKIKESEELLKKSVEEKTRQIWEANDELQKKNHELLKTNKELESFAYISSHDLQEPLRKIQIFATRIGQTENNNLSQQGLDYFQRMKDSAFRMQVLIQDLLSYSRTANAEQRLVQTDLNKAVEDVVNDMKEIIQEKNAIVETHLHHDLCVIPFQFQQAIYNLISNALKFSKSKVQPHIIINDEIETVGLLQKENPAFAKALSDTDGLENRVDLEKKYCHISVSDNGIGFDPQYKDQIFEVFQRLFSKDEYPGTGIGLSIVKRIVENHNGVITATGELQKGATFDIYIPVT